MSTPRLTIDLDKIEHNALTITGLCRRHGIAVAGVTKATCGDPRVAAAMLRGGVTGIADSRLDNLRRLREAGIGASLMLLRLPALSEVDAVVATADVSLNAEPATLAALSDAALRRGRLHEVILMVELGDLREGVPVDELSPLVGTAAQLSGIRVVGLGANLTCLSGVVPSEDHMCRLAGLAGAVERQLTAALRWVSGVNSGGLDLLAAGRMPERINHARIGEAILLGRETTHRRPWPETFQDAFTLHAEILELRHKPSRPLGEQAEDAFGRHPAFENHGRILHALVNIGCQDVGADGVRPRDDRLSILAASSDYLALDVSAAEGELEVGDELTFTVDYCALLAAMTSAYVEKRPIGGGEGDDA